MAYGDTEDWQTMIKDLRRQPLSDMTAWYNDQAFWAEVADYLCYKGRLRFEEQEYRFADYGRLHPTKRATLAKE